MDKKKIGRLRYFVQLFFFLWVLGIVVVRALVEAGLSLPFSVKLISLHSICPFGGIVTLYTLVTEGSLVRQIHESAVVLAGLSILLALFFGPVICGWVCPFGTVQQWMGKLGKKLFKKRYNTFVPRKIDRYLRFIRYGVLVWVLVMTARSATLVFQTYDPFYALFNFYKSDVSKISLAILVFILLLSLFIERPFCKYACPYGAFLGLFNKIRFFKLKRNESTCINCSLCNQACPMNIDIASSKVVSSTQCISCLACTSEQACPVASTVRVEGPKQRIALTTKGLAAVTLLVLLGGIMLSMG
ncbi:MAG: 4Fe-4S binding protein, partial [Bacteroidia bacterium]|nr:4Fe-4S binding protein [Bacteroidia bacterium]